MREAAEAAAVSLEHVPESPYLGEHRLELSLELDIPWEMPPPSAYRAKVLAVPALGSSQTEPDVAAKWWYCTLEEEDADIAAREHY